MTDRPDYDLSKRVERLLAYRWRRWYSKNREEFPTDQTIADHVREDILKMNNVELLGIISEAIDDRTDYG